MNVITKTFTVPAADTISFNVLVKIKEILVTSNAGCIATITFGMNAGQVRGYPAGWIENQTIMRVSGSWGSRIKPNAECRNLTVDISTAVTQVTIVYEYVDKV